MAEHDIGRLRSMAARKLDFQAGRAARYQRYYDGEQDVPVILDTDERQAFRRFLDEARANWCELVVNAVAERLQVDGFQFSGADSVAWDIWQGSRMDADAELVQTDALVTSSGFVLVQADDDSAAGVVISPESPYEACVLYEPGNRRKRIAGYKRWTDQDTGLVTEILLTPDVIATWRGHDAVPELEANPAGVVGMIEIIAQPRTYGPARSELAPAMQIQDRINTTLFNRLVATDYGAFRQVWATGVKVARQVTGCDDDGNPVSKPVRPYDVGANRLLVAENPQARFGAISESTLGGYLASVEQDVNHLAAITQTPPHYLLGTIANLSADAIKAAEAGLVAKTRRRSRHIGEAWEEVMRTALTLIGHPAAADTSAEVIWSDQETRSEGQRVDALVKMATLGVPRDVLWQRWGATPQEIERWKQMAHEQAAADASAQAAAFGMGAYDRILAEGS
jgi:hypothetical protein